jgi:DNA-binding HxlR family transcriptional regulator
MDKIRYDSSASCLKLLGDYWTLRILDALSDGEMRYCELQRRIDNLNPVTLTGRLKKLEEARLINRYEDLEDKVAVVYALTGLGSQTLPVIDAITNFSAKAELA